MRKLNLVAIGYDRDKILNALQRTGAAEVKTHSDMENLARLPSDCDEMKSYLASAEAALEVLSQAVDNYDKEHKVKSDILKDGFDVSYTEFMNARENRAKADEVVAKINSLLDEKARVANDLARCLRTVNSSRIFSCVEEPLNIFVDTAHTIVRLGTIPTTERDKFAFALGEIPLADYKVLNADDDSALVLLCAHKCALSETEEILSSCSFARIPFEGDRSGAEVYADALAEENVLREREREVESQMLELREQIRPLKVYCDYVSFELEKLLTNEKLLATERTFLLEAYVPAGAEEVVANAINEASSAVYYEFCDPAEDEMPPTLMRNKPLVNSFETITNMYSPPNARELDPTLIMSFFYSLFLGFIMADVGYGLLMLLGGGAIWLKTRNRPTGITGIAGVFAVGGVFSIIWGFLFNSLFGIAILPAAVMPDAQRDMWSLAGINVPAVLVISMEIGTAQLFAGYVCRAVQCWRRGQILDGLCDGVTWAVFSVGVALAIVGFVQEANASSLATIGAIIAAVGLAAAVLTAGRKEKFFGKFTKGFGAAYGVINYASDILSYARLYGLMLSGAVIAQIVSQYGVQFITGGNVAFAIIGVLLMVVGHAFNLAMSLLGAYIHDARLQYVEFYGRFFEGEGQLFTPLGSTHKYVYITSAESGNK
jgi:V/A-type H+-transporting ATPase subunit I